MMCPACLLAVDLDPGRMCLHPAPSAATFWIGGEWPSLDEVFAVAAGSVPQAAAATHDRWYQRAQREATAAALQRMPGRVFVVFRHFRRGYKDRERWGCARFAESVVLDVLTRGGLFQSDKLDGVTHVFLQLERGEHRLPIASPGLQVVVLERP